jgi:hypothetical protein
MKKAAMMRIWLIGLIIILVTSISHADARQDYRKMAEEEVKKYFHELLEEKLNYDPPIENILQSFDHLAHGEYDKAKNVAYEEAAKQFVSLLLGSEGGVVVTFAWDFAKNTFIEVQKWSKAFEWQHIFIPYLNRRIEDWKNRGDVLPWKDEIAMLNRAIDEWSGDGQLARGRFVNERKQYTEKFRSEAWSKLLKVHTAYRKYFLQRKLAKKTAMFVLRQYRNKIEVLAARYETAAEYLKFAKEPVDKIHINRFLKDPSYRKEVTAVASVNKVFPDAGLTLKRYDKTVWKFLTKNYSAQELADAAYELKAHGYKATPENVRRYLNGSDSYRNTNLSNKGKTYLPIDVFVTPKNEFSALQNDAIRSEIEMRNIKNFEKTLNETMKRSIDHTQRLRERQSTKEIDMTLFIKRINDVKNNYLNGKITIYTAVDQWLEIYKKANRYFNIILGVSKEDYQEYERFDKALKKAINIVREKRQKAMSRIYEQENSLCQEDKLLQSVHSSISDIQREMGKYYIDLDQLRELQNIGYDYLKGYDTTYKDFKPFNNLLLRVQKEISLFQKILPDLEQRIQDNYNALKRHRKLIERLYDRYASFVEAFPYALTYPGKIYPFVYQDKQILPSCHPQIDKHYLQAQKRLANMYEQFSYLQMLESRLIALLSYFELQHLYNLRMRKILEHLVKLHEKYDKTQKAIQNFENKTDYLTLPRIPEHYIRDFERTSDAESLYRRIVSQRNGVEKHSLEWYRKLLKSIQAEFETYMQNVRNRYDILKKMHLLFAEYNRYEKSTRIIEPQTQTSYKNARNFFYLTNEVIDKPETVRSDYEQLFEEKKNALNRLYELEATLYRKLRENDDDYFMLERYIFAVKALPFVTSFDLNRFEKKLLRLKKEMERQHYKAPKIEEIYYGKIPVSHNTIELYPVDLKKNRITIKGTYRIFNDPLKEIFYKIGSDKKSCSIDPDKKHFACKIFIPKKEGNYDISIGIKSLHALSDSLHFTLAFRIKAKDVEAFLRRFQKRFNTRGNLQPFFSYGAYYVSELKSATKRSKPFLKLFLNAVRIERHELFYKDADGRQSRLYISVPWENRKKRGTVSFVIDKFVLSPIQNRRFAIARIEGEPFWKYDDDKATAKHKGHIRLRHASKHYSYDFESRRYFDVEKDIAAGYVNPKVQEASHPYFNVGMLRDMGTVQNWETIRCPSHGYSDFYDMTPAKVGHTYCLLTQEGNYALVHVTKTGGSETRAFIEADYVFPAR